MSFNTFIFWLVFPCIFAIYWILPDRVGGGANYVMKESDQGIGF